MSTQKDWFSFQEQICDHFISLGADAQTSVRIEGIRTCHDIDVFIKTKFLGQNMIWLIEAKHWKKRVNKSHVLALRTIVDDIGADRGFIVSTKGFQSGAVEAAQNTNVKLKTFEELKAETTDMVEAEILKTYKKRLLIIEDRYWSHSKEIRIKYRLRHDIATFDMSFIGQIILSTARSAILSAEARDYPILLEPKIEEQQGQSIIYNFQQLQNWLNLNLNYFEEKLLTAEWEMYKNGDYAPKTIRTPPGKTTTTENSAKIQYAIRKDQLEAEE